MLFILISPYCIWQYSQIAMLCQVIFSSSPFIRLSRVEGVKEGDYCFALPYILMYHRQKQAEKYG